MPQKHPETPNNIPEIALEKDFNDGKTAVGYKMTESLAGTNYFAWYITTDGI